MVLDLDDARTRYHFAFTREDHERLPFYSALIRALEDDSDALALLAGVRVEQRNPMLILASLHLAALRGHSVLAPIYRSARHGLMTDVGAATRDVLRVVHDDPDLVRAELHRSTQTNEPGRCAVFQAVIAQIARRHPSINLIDVGTSAGINLYFDRFPVRASDDGVALTLVCHDQTAIDRTLPMPVVVSRVGIDPAPLDLGNDDDRLWLEACLWPEEPRRMERLEAIVAARATWPSTTILKGTAAQRLPDAIALGDPSSLTVVVNSYVAGYFAVSEQLTYFEEMTRRCLNENVAWLSFESPFMVNWPRVRESESEMPAGATQILVTLPGGAPTEWGWCHHHGKWLSLHAPF